MFIEIKLCNRMTHVIKGHFKVFMLKFNVPILKRVTIMFFGKYKAYT